jgi:hypothetical protein
MIDFLKITSNIHQVSVLLNAPREDNEQKQKQPRNRDWFVIIFEIGRVRNFLRVPNSQPELVMRVRVKAGTWQG